MVVSGRKGKGGAFHGSRLVRPAIRAALPGPGSWVNFKAIYGDVQEVADVTPYTVRAHLRKMAPGEVRVRLDPHGFAYYQGVAEDGSYFPDYPMGTPFDHRPKTFSKRPRMSVTLGPRFDRSRGFGKRVQVCKGCGERIPPPDEVKAKKLIRWFENAQWQRLNALFDPTTPDGLARLRRGLSPPSLLVAGHLILVQLHALDQCKAAYVDGRAHFAAEGVTGAISLNQYPLYRPRYRATGGSRGRNARLPLKRSAAEAADDGDE